MRPNIQYANEKLCAYTSTLRVMKYTWESIPQVVRFLFVGGVNTLFGYLCYASLLYLELHFTCAALFGTVLGVAFNYLTNSRLVFDANLFSGIRLQRFIVVYLIQYLVNISCIWVLGQFGLNPYLSGLVLILPLAGITYLLMKFFVYNGKSAI